MFDRCSISHFLSPLSDLPFPISYFYVPFRSSFVHFPWLLARPGGMRGAIESAALAVWQELACRIQSTSPKLQISNLQISNPPQNSPQRPRAFRPAAQKRSADRFCDFHFARHSPSEMQKNYAPWILLRICIKNVIYKTAF